MSAAPTSRRRLLALGGGVAAVVLVAGALALPHLLDDDPQAAGMPTGAPARAAAPGGARFVSGVADGGRYFVDQHGQPLLVRGDSPWSLLVDLLPAQAETYLTARAAEGFNAEIVALLGATANGGPADDGSTVDGLRPFDGDVTHLDPQYWARAHDVVQRAAAHGLTMFLYPVDGWSVGKAFDPASADACRTYGQRLGEWAADLPNVVWVYGGDYFPQTNEPAKGSDVDRCMAAVTDGLHAAGDTRPFSVQLGYDVSRTTDDPFWKARAGWTFAYSYFPTYRAVLDGYAAGAPRPVLLGEANYEGENNQGDTPPTTNETLRRQALWALTSGAAGDFFGTSDWKLPAGWQSRLDSPGAREVNQARDLVAALRWWELVPDTARGERPLVVGGRGDEVRDDSPHDVLDSDWASAARTPDGEQAVVYVPTSRTVKVDLALLADGVRATWVDPVTGAARPAGTGPLFRVPGPNADGDHDWLLVFGRPA